MDRDEMFAEHLARAFRIERRDALHPWTIAQNETDCWLQFIVQYLASLLLRPEEEQIVFGARLKEAYEEFPRRRVSADIQVGELERLLSLPLGRDGMNTMESGWQRRSCELSTTTRSRSIIATAS